jgi:hypothetical protein
MKQHGSANSYGAIHGWSVRLRTVCVRDRQIFAEENRSRAPKGQENSIITDLAGKLL